MSNFTKGPWFFKPSKYQSGTHIVQAGMPSNRVLASFGEDGEVDDEDYANAHLIHAAPDLYEALEAMLNWAGEIAGDNCDTEAAKIEMFAVEKARSALAKAKGETNDSRK